MNDNLKKLIESDIRLNEPDHRYILESNKGITFNSVTRIVDSHFKPFDRWKIARILTSNNPKYYHLTARQLVKNWENKRDHGSKVHQQIERYIINKKKPTYKKAKHGIKAVKEIRKIFGTELYSEVIIFSTRWLIAGMVDLIVYNKNKQMIYIFDWKTTANINRVNGGVGITNITNGIRDTTLNKYSLQLSAYNYLLNKSHNIKVHSQYVVHLTDKGYHIIDSEYREGIIKDIFNKQIKLKPKIRKKKNPRKQSLNKRKTKQPVNKRKLVKGPSDSLRNRCKKLGVPLTRQVNGKRVYKTTKMLQQHCRLKENKRLNKSAKRIKNEKNSDNIFGYTMLLLAIFFVIIAGSLLGWIN